MNLSPRQKRFALIAGGVLVLCIAAAFVLNAFNSNLVFFFTPTQVLNGEAPRNKTFRIGGMVKTGSLQRDGTRVSFVVTDTINDRQGRGRPRQNRCTRCDDCQRSAGQTRRKLHAARGPARAGQSGPGACRPICQTLKANSE